VPRKCEVLYRIEGEITTSGGSYPGELAGQDDSGGGVDFRKKMKVNARGSGTELHTTGEKYPSGQK